MSALLQKEATLDGNKSIIKRETRAEVWGSTPIASKILFQ